MRYRYRSDDELKDSGVEWIGKIPKDWELKYLKYIIKNNDGGTWGEEQKYNNDDIIVIRSTEVDEDGKWRIDNPAIRNINEKEKQRCILLEGDLLITKSSGSEKHIGKTAIVTSEIENMKCVFSNFMQRIRVKSVNSSKLLFYIMNSNISKLQINYLSTTTTGLVNINSELINRIKIPTTTLFEQEKIANFLDEKTSQFDSIISKKEKLIERLEEAKKSLISEIVTGKVKVVKTDDRYELVKRSSEEMNDSGVEWLGEIPKEWSLQKGKWLFYNSNEKGDESKILLSATQDRGVIPKEYVEGAVQNKEDTDFTNFKLVKKYDFIISLRSFQGGFEMSEYDEGIITPAYSVLRSKVELNPYYYKYLLKEKGFIGILNSLTVGIRDGKNIKYDDFAKVLLPKPSLDEQYIISDYINKFIFDINIVTNKTSKQIEKLKEAKQSLISEAVTGKIEILD